ncbi:CMRF35-like molecule 7 [Perognathus longimembris pacificus]|uniref:CMRF35-like molecule 7 n=1 Tax=Perognathus longimembris pacificus TaxID=214514 RepID=UPI0020190E4B|nr:CMRF35-like molecule 7 [Perognathus longimembris pacificus]
MWLPPALLLLGLPGCLAIQGPGSVRGSEEGSVTIQCRYDPRWKAYNKWWCRGRTWHTCQILVRTRGSEEEKKNERVSIRDDQSNCWFTVTMERLRREDADTYWCGIQRTGTDLGIRITVTVGPGKNILVEEGSTTDSKPLVRTTAHSNSEVSFGLYSRSYYMLLVFVKVPILLVVAGAVLWFKGGSEAPSGAVGTARRGNWNSEFLTKDRSAQPSHLDPESRGSLGEAPPQVLRGQR